MKKLNRRTDRVLDFDIDLPMHYGDFYHFRFLYEDVLWKKYGLTGKDMKYLKAYQIAKGKNVTLLEILDNAKNKDNSFIDKITLIKQGFCASVETSYSSNPEKNSSDWETIFHPLFGWCHHFEPVFKKKISLNRTIVEFVKFYVNYEKAYKNRTKEGKFWSQRVHDTPIFDEARQTLIIMVYHKGSFFNR